MITFREYCELPSKSETLKIDRKDMPQIKGKDVKDFLQFLKISHGVTSSKANIDPSILTATQQQFHKAKIVAIMSLIQNDSYDNTPILISNDNYVLDGHHRWLAHLNLKKDIQVIQVDDTVKNVLSMMHSYPKSFTKKLYEEYNMILEESGEVCEVLPKQHMIAFENLVDRLFSKFRIDFDFTTHFRERMADSRNKPCISLKELGLMIQKLYKKNAKSNTLLSKYKDAEAVIKDLQTDLNMPVAVEYNRNKDELSVVAKTIMRKKDFKTPDPSINLS